MNKILLHSITFFLLTIFVTLKVVNTHYFVHIFDEDQKIVNCDFCDDYQKNSQTEFTSPDPEPQISNVLLTLFSRDLNNFYFYQPQVTILGNNFNRPPPALV